MEELDDFYQEYGEALTTRLRDLAGSVFVFVEDMGDPKEVQAVINGGKADGAQLLIWEQFVEDLDTAGRDNFHSKIVGSVAVLSKGKDRPAIRQAYATGRKSVLSVLKLMLSDTQEMINDTEEGILYNKDITMDVRTFPLEKAMMSASWYGYGLQFTWFVPLDLTLDPADVLSA